MLTDLELGASVYEARKLGGATALHAAADTPYGKVMQSMTLELTDGETMQWDIIHPFAFIYYLSTLCAQFAATMAASVYAVGSMEWMLIPIAQTKSKHPSICQVSPRLGI